MNYKELKKDMFIKWYADRMFSGWDTYGVVTNIDADDVTIKTFDDMKETTLNLQGDAVKSEISIANIEDVEAYFDKKETDLQIKKIQIEAKFKSDMKLLNKQVETLHELVKSIFI